MRKCKRRPDLHDGRPHNTSRRERRKAYK